jgi:hypothetical protein
LIPSGFIKKDVGFWIVDARIHLLLNCIDNQLVTFAFSISCPSATKEIFTYFLQKDTQISSSKKDLSLYFG